MKRSASIPLRGRLSRRLVNCYFEMISFFWISEMGLEVFLWDFSGLI
jgi:hypothetical protein